MSTGKQPPVCSTPKYNNCDKFERKIDSFTFNNTSPVWSSNTSAEDFSTPVSKTDSAKKTDLTKKTDSTKETDSAKERGLPHTLQLRSGNRYCRRRSRSVGDKITGKQVQNLPKLVVSDNYNILNNKMSLNIASISQLVINNIPLLGAEVGPSLASDVDTFIKCCEHINLCLTEEVDKKLFLQLIPTKFRGRAALILDGIEYKTLEELKSILLTKLVNTKSYQVQLNDLRCSRQFPGESLFSFGRRVMQLLKGCKASASKKHSSGLEAVYSDLEETAVFTFKSGILNPHHRFLLLSDTETSLEKIIRAAEQLEQTEIQMLEMQRFQSTYNPFPLPYSSATYPNYIPNSMNIPQSNSIVTNLSSTIPYSTTNTNTGILGSFIAQNNPENVNYMQFPTNRSNLSQNVPVNRLETNPKPLKQEIKCGFCNRKNHSYAECRIRKSTPFCPQCKIYGHNVSNCPKNNPRYQTNTMNVNSTRKKCNFCQRNGHTIETCGAKKLWEANSIEKQNCEIQEN